MSSHKPMVHPYIPNSNPAIKAEMLAAIGARDIGELYEEIPAELRFKGRMNLPEPYTDEYSLRRHVEGLINRNRGTHELLSFLGAGCWPHYVPAICDEINSRSEFLTAYAGEPYEDHGRFQALFEYESMVAELVEMDVVSVPTYDGHQAASTAVRMAGRITGRRQVLLPRTIHPDQYLIMQNYNQTALDLVFVDYDRQTGQMDLADLRRKLSADTAAVFIENPSYVGIIEAQGQQIADLAHAAGALLVVKVDPISLGVLASPASYGADIVAGELQPLGMHMQFGGGMAGFIATRDEERFVSEFPSRLFGVTSTVVPGEWGFGDVAYERTSFAEREHGKEFVGTHAAMWGITAGVYLALMGPRGMQEVGQVIMQKGQYAMRRLAAIPGVKAPALPGGVPFKEFLVDFTGTGRTVARINQALLAQGIFGGKDLSAEFPELGQVALYCVTEVHTREEIDRLVAAVAGAVA